MLPRTFRDEFYSEGRLEAATIARSDAAVLAALDTIDRAVLGFTRSIDHQFWFRLDDQSLVLLALRDEPIAYAYISKFGGIGPCAARSSRYLPSLLAHSMAAAAEQGIERASFVVPGLASAALAYLLQHSARYETDMTLLLSSKPFGRLDRYLLPASDALF